MAITQNTLIGASRKKVGGTVFSSWKGINVLKAKPLTVANPRSDTQVMNRSAMSQAVAIFRLISNVIGFGYIQQAVKQSAYNAFVSELRKNAFDYSLPPVATLIEGNILITKGTIGSTPVITNSITGAVIDIGWSPSPLPVGGSSSDTCVAALYNSTLNEWAQYDTNTTRASGSAVLPFPGNWGSGETIFVYTGFVNKTTRKADTSLNYVENIP